MQQDNGKVGVTTAVRNGQWYVSVYVNGNRTQLGPFDRVTAMRVENEQRMKIGLAQRQY